MQFARDACVRCGKTGGGCGDVRGDRIPDGRRIPRAGLALHRARGARVEEGQAGEGARFGYDRLVAPEGSGAGKVFDTARKLGDRVQSGYGPSPALPFHCAGAGWVAADCMGCGLVYPSGMCGRFTITHPNEALAALFDAVPGNDLPQGPNFNVCPTNPVAVVSSDAGQRRLRAMRWGFIPGWYKAPNDGPLIINARSDTVATKPAFRDAVRARRCIVPASGFYEWSTGPRGEKLPWYFRRGDDQPMALAGLWQRWGDIDTVAIVSTEAGPGMAGLHHREAVVLERSDWPLWLGEAGHGAAVLMKASSDGVLTAPFRVGVAVNSNRASGPDLILPIAA